jgi:glycerophosphoryl diester phosphodiesterase
MRAFSPSQSIWIIGHRGAAGEAIENTLDSFWLAIRQGADMVELDVQLTQDLQLVAFHDWDLEGSAGQRLTIEGSRLSEIQQVGVGGEESEDSRRAHIPSLEEICATLPASLPLNIELKRRTADSTEMANQLRKLVGSRRRVLVSSFDWELLSEVKRMLPTCPLAPIGRDDPQALLEAADWLDAFSVHCSRRIVDRRLIGAATLQNRPLLVYTVNDQREADGLFASGVRGIFTDFPGRLRRGLEE